MNNRQKEIINQLISKTNERITSFSFKSEIKEEVSKIMDLFRQLSGYENLNDGGELVEQAYQEFNGIEQIK